MIAAIFQDHDFASRHQDVIAKSMAAVVGRERHASLTFRKGATPFKGQFKAGSIADKAIRAMKAGHIYTAAEIATVVGLKTHQVSHAMTEMVRRGQVERVSSKLGEASTYRLAEGNT